MGKEFGKWEVIETLPEGGQAWVYLVKGKESSSDVQYVLKRLKNPNRLDRFKGEVEALQNLNHPNIAKLIDFDLGDKNPWFVQEYYHGGDLDKYVQKNGPLDHNKALNFLIDMASGLEYAHSSGKLHRDIKPANIFLEDEDGPAVLGDFGLAWKVDRGERLTLTVEAVGSFHYMAPELADGRADEPTWQCDIYSLGKVLYFMLSGGRVFDREIYRDPKIVQGFFCNFDQVLPRNFVLRLS
jgi:serine/threonine protein kinase